MSWPANLTPDQLVAYLATTYGIARSKRTLANYRAGGRPTAGPAYHRISQTELVYPRAGADAWARELLGLPAASTAEERGRGADLPDMAKALAAKGGQQ